MLKTRFCGKRETFLAFSENFEEDDEDDDDEGFGEIMQDSPSSIGRSGGNSSGDDEEEIIAVDDKETDDDEGGLIRDLEAKLRQAALQNESLQSKITELEQHNESTMKEKEGLAEMNLLKAAAQIIELEANVEALEHEVKEEKDKVIKEEGGRSGTNERLNQMKKDHEKEVFSLIDKINCKQYELDQLGEKWEEKKKGMLEEKSAELRRVVDSILEVSKQERATLISEMEGIVATQRREKHEMMGDGVANDSDEDSGLPAEREAQNEAEYEYSYDDDEDRD